MVERFAQSARGTGDRPGPLLGSRGEAPGSHAIWCTLEDVDHLIFAPEFFLQTHCNGMIYSNYHNGLSLNNFFRLGEMLVWLWKKQSTIDLGEGCCICHIRLYLWSICAIGQGYRGPPRSPVGVQGRSPWKPSDLVHSRGCRPPIFVHQFYS